MTSELHCYHLDQTTAILDSIYTMNKFTSPYIPVYIHNVHLSPLYCAAFLGLPRGLAPFTFTPLLLNGLAPGRRGTLKSIVTRAAETTIVLTRPELAISGAPRAPFILAIPVHIVTPCAVDVVRTLPECVGWVLRRSGLGHGCGENMAGAEDQTDELQGCCDL